MHPSAGRVDAANTLHRELSLTHPNWRNLGQEHLPPFPEQMVRLMLERFGLDSGTELEAWPHGPSDILARFLIDGVPHLLKSRRVEQRGE